MVTPAGTAHEQLPELMILTTVDEPSADDVSTHLANVMSKVFEVAEVSAPEVARSVYPVPTVVMLNPLNVATPLTALTITVPVRVPELAAIVTDAVELVTVLP